MTELAPTKELQFKKVPLTADLPQCDNPADCLSPYLHAMSHPNALYPRSCAYAYEWLVGFDITGGGE